MVKYLTITGCVLSRFEILEVSEKIPRRKGGMREERWVAGWGSVV